MDGQGNESPVREQLHPGLSQLLVAYLIETDNAAEGWLPHRTSAFGEGGPPSPAPRNGHKFRRPWLVSVTVWQNLLRFIPEEGVAIDTLRAARGARGAQAAGSPVRRWGYVREAGERVVPSWGGKMACRIWAELESATERRWRERFGTERVAALRAALEPLAGALSSTTPRGFPVSGFGDGGRVHAPLALGPGLPVPAAELDLGTLLARAVLASSLAYEQDSELSALIGFDLVEPVSDAGGRLTRSELVARSGLAPETVTSLAGGLVRGGYLAQSHAERAIVFTLTGRGAEAAAAHAERALAAENAFERMLGAEASARLADLVDSIRSDAAGLRETLAVPAGGWRSRPPYAARTAALLADPAALLPRHPAVTHRGGFPDGA